jgi:hypothetical protein
LSALSATVQAAIGLANTKGVLFVVAAGNDADNNGTTAAYPCNKSGPLEMRLNLYKALTSTLILPADTTIPSTPTGLTATAISNAQIHLAWTAATDNIGVTDYEVDPCSGAGCTGFTLIATVSGTRYSNNTGLSPNTAYSYRIRAIDAKLNKSANSSTVSATTLTDTTTPSAPSGLTATAVSNTQIHLWWTKSTDTVGVTAYEVQRCSGSGCPSFAFIGNSPSASINYFDSGLTTNSFYSYRARAKDAAGNASAYSSTATTTATAPANGPGSIGPPCRRRYIVWLLGLSMANSTPWADTVPQVWPFPRWKSTLQ